MRNLVRSYDRGGIACYASTFISQEYICNLKRKNLCDLGFGIIAMTAKVKEVV